MRVGIRPTRRSAARGVSLVEVLAALALIAAVAPALNRAWVLTMASAARATDDITAATLAENKLAEIVAAGASASAEDSGDFGAGYEDFRWQSDRNAWTGDNAMTQITVTVTWTRRNVPCRLTISTLVAGGDQ